MNFVKVLKSRVKDNFRLIKFLRKGKSDNRECKVIAPHGIDSHPVGDMIALYAETSVNGKNVIIGYISKNAIADIGELRMYSTDSDGVEQNYIYLKNDGDIEVGGNADNMVRFSQLESAFNQLKGDLNSFITVFNTHVHSGVTTGPGSTGSSPTPGTSSAADISGAKIDEVKTS